MADEKGERTDLSANLINAADVLLAPTHDLTRKSRLRPAEVQTLVREVSRGISPRTSLVGDLIGESSSSSLRHSASAGLVPDSGAGTENANASGTVSVQEGTGLFARATRDAGDETPHIGPGKQGFGKRKRLSNGAGRENFSEGEWIRTGDEGWDRLLGGGIRVGCVTEITGESAAGKSHLSLLLALSTQLPTLSTYPGGTIILTSERQLSTLRLHDLAESLKRRHASNLFMTRDKLGDGVYTMRVGDVEGLDHALSYGVPAMLEKGRSGNGNGGRGGTGGGGRLMGFEPLYDEDEGELEQTGNGAATMEGEATGTDSAALMIQPIHPSASSVTSVSKRSRTVRSTLAPISLRTGKSRPLPIRLLVLDSITALLRGAETAFSSSSAGLTARSRHLCVIADKIKALAVEYQIAVVVINQVSDVFDRTSYPTRSVQVDEDDDLLPPGRLPVNDGKGQAGLRPSQSNPHSSQSLTHSQAWYSSGPDPPMLYATQSKWFSGQASAKTKEAALGVVWANAVNTRIMLSRTERRRMIKSGELGRGVEKEEERWRALNPLARVGSQLMEGSNLGQVGDTTDREVTWKEAGTIGAPLIHETKQLIRRAHVVFSPFAPSATIDFVITATGLHTLPESYKIDESGEEIMKRVIKRREANKVGGEEENFGDGRDGEDGDAEGEMGEVYEDELFGMGRGLEEVPEGWWEGRVDGDVQTKQ